MVQPSGRVHRLAGARSKEETPRRTPRTGWDHGDIKDLVDELLGYKRLRVGPFRVIYREAFEHGKPVRKCLFAERRNVVYELFAQMLLDDLH